MWTLLIFLNLVALHCKASTSPPDPVNVIFSAVNLRNVLQWKPGNGTPEDTHFTVQYAIYGDSVEGSKGRRVNWRAVRRCTEIMRNWCDLSNETWDLEHGYYGRVRAVSRRTPSKWAWTRRRFDPKTDTSFGPPLVSVEVEDNNAIITLKGPMRYQPNNHTPAVSMATLYPMMTYNLSIKNTHRDQHHFPVASSSYKYRMMEYNTEYCFSARSRFFSMPAQCQSSAWQCITTPQDPVIGQLQRVVVGIVVPALCISMLVVVGYLLHHYLTGKGQKSPYILDPPAFYPPPPIFPSEIPKLFPITIITEPLPERGLSNRACSKRPQQVAHPSSGYASQRPETPPVSEDDLSIDYGFISVAPKIDIRGENWNNLDGEHQKCNRYEKKGCRVEDGHSTGDSLTEKSTLLQAQPWPQSVLRTQTQAPLPSVQGPPIGEVDGEEEDREFPGLFINSTPQTGLFSIPLNLQTTMEGGMGEEMDRTMRVRTDEEIDGGVEERSENVPLLSAYASQNTTDTPTSYADQSDYLPDDYGVLRLDTAHKTEADEDEDEGTICIDWDPQVGKLVLPEIAMGYNKAGGLDGLMQGEKGRENGMGGEEEEVNLTKGELRLENVFVRQGSEEKAEAQREMERGEGKGEVDDFLTRWNLVISMDE